MSSFWYEIDPIEAKTLDISEFDENKIEIFLEIVNRNNQEVKFQTLPVKYNNLKWTHRFQFETNTQAEGYFIAKFWAKIPKKADELLEKVEIDLTKTPLYKDEEMWYKGNLTSSLRVHTKVGQNIIS